MRNRIATILRLTRAEFLKASSHPFLLIAVIIAILVVLAAILLQYLQAEVGESSFDSINALQLFAAGFKEGMKMVSMIVVIFGAMAFAGEYDRGTIKNLLTRPVTRTDFFLAKALFIVLLTIVLLLLLFFVAAFVSLLAGDLGPIWDKESYKILLPYDEVTRRLITVLAISLLSPFAAAFIGLLISNVTESSAYAVAMALVLFFVLDIGTIFLGVEEKKWIFLFYPDHAFGVLKQYTEGITTYPMKDLEAMWRHALAVPAGTIAALGAAAYALFRLKDVHA
ncbi:MAG: hypothetical protein A2Z34_10575 [Planctomycetes bacterium RBG_16_59_8]|nr:MAG: hypothetical protein A2Z34_10575 [Planctomycetes bacterium RBG_16_59_8]